MSSNPSNIAQELEENQREISIAEFFDKNKQMLGFDSKSRAIVTTVKEAVDNAFDAAEEARILPEIDVFIEESGKYYSVSIQDNGPGITEENIPNVFGKLLYGSRFHRDIQSRGQQGIGISAAVLYSQQTSGKPAKVTSKTADSDTAYEYKVRINTDTNEPEILNKRETDYEHESGTRIELEMEANLRGRKQLENYIRNTGIVNPYAIITLESPNISYKSERVTKTLPDKPEEIKPHPHGVQLGVLQDMIEETSEDSLYSFLRNDFTKVGDKTANTIIDNYNEEWFGRELALPITMPDDEFEDALYRTIHRSISRKSPEAKEELSDCITSKLLDSDAVSYTTIKKAVEDCSDTVENTFDERIGETVRTNVIETVFETLYFQILPYFQEQVNNATSNRKKREVTDELVSRVLRQVYLVNSMSNHGRISNTVLSNLIAGVASSLDDEYGVPFGDTSQEKIFSVFWDECMLIRQDVPELTELLHNRDKRSALQAAFTATKVQRPSSKCLSPIGPELIESGLKEEYDAEYYTAAKREGGVYKGSPFIVEAGIAYGGNLDESSQIDIDRFANKVPLVYQQSACAITNTIENIRWRNYKLSQSGNHGVPVGPAVLLVHVASTNVPFTSESKDAVANVPEIEEQIEHAVRDVARGVKSHIKEQQSLQERKQKQQAIGDIVNPMADAFADVVGLEERPDTTRSIARIMNNVGVENTSEDNSSLSLSIYNHNSKEYEFTVRIKDSEHFVSIEPGEEVSVSETIDDIKNTTVILDGIEHERVSHNLIEDGRRKTEGTPLVEFSE